VEGVHSLEPQKAHPTSGFTIVAENRGHSLLCLASRLAAVVGEVGEAVGETIF